MGDVELFLNKKIERTRTQLGVITRQPRGQLVPFSFGGADVFDSTDTMDVFAFVPDEIYVTVRCKVAIAFREFFAPATAASSGGGSTSGASSASSSASGGSSSPTSDSVAAHHHLVFDFVGGSPGVTSDLNFETTDSGGGAHGVSLKISEGYDIYTRQAAGGHSHTVTIGSHTHNIEHTHSTPAHTHGLTYGVFKEAMPASHSVILGVYKLDGASWTLIVSISGLTDDVEELDLSQYVDGPGLWRLSLQSAGGTPQGGRLGCDVAGFLLGAIRSA